jgi:IS4 transposase
MFSRWTDDGVYFVTRQKGNAVFGIVQEKSVPKHRNILKDQLIEYDGFYSRKKCSGILRRIEVWDDEKKEVIVLLTNHLTFGATTISAIYKDRWQIEIFFKMLKQNLRIKTFVGTSKNALLIQIWTALIAILILKYLKFISLFDWSLSNLIAMLRYNLFTYRNLWEWINKPFEVPAMVPHGEQMALEFK